jgi:ABC-2 type transport system permease protein
MNLRGGWALIRRLWMSYTSSRAFFWILALGHLVGPLIYMFAWITAAGQGLVSGYSRDEFIVYYLILIFIQEFTYPVSNWTVGDFIRMGMFSSWLLRPLHPIYEAIGTDLALKVVNLPFTGLVVILLGLILKPEVSFQLQDVLLFIPALILGYMLRFLLAYALALMAFWSSRADALLRLNDTLLFLFSGMVAPIMLLPDGLRQIAMILPYRYMLGFPIQVLTGALSPTELLAGFTGQIVWLLVAFLFHQIVWKNGLRHYSAVGG